MSSNIFKKNQNNDHFSTYRLRVLWLVLVMGEAISKACGRLFLYLRDKIANIA